jgi:putative hydrolase of the HAD superfamily
MTAERPKALLVDYGCVISREQPEQAIAEMASVAGLDVDEFVARYWEHRLAYDRGLDARTYWSTVLGNGPPDERSLERLVRLDIASWGILNAGTLEILTAAHRDGIALSLLSNAPYELADALDGHRALALFDHLVFSARIGAVKPEPAAFAAALEAMSLRPQDVVFIDDRQENVEGAIACGLRGILFSSADQLREVLALHGWSG